jgi:hypothetical protein
VAAAAAANRLLFYGADAAAVKKFGEKWRRGEQIFRQGAALPGTRAILPKKQPLFSPLGRITMKTVKKNAWEE